MPDTRGNGVTLTWIIFDAVIVAALVLLFVWRSRIRQSNRRQVAVGDRAPLTSDQIRRRRVIGFIVAAALVALIIFHLTVTYGG